MTTRQENGRKPEVRAQLFKANLRHSHARRGLTSKTYNAWHAMLGRCLNKNDPFYRDYGGRGIKVCEKWKKFDNFLADMGEAQPGLSLDRKDNNGDYTPSNCRWATAYEQARNNGRNVFYTFQGKTMCVTDWAASIGICVQGLRHRIERGWPLEKALTTPSNRAPK